MTERDGQPGRPEKSRPSTHRVRVPGFVADVDIGLGDVVKRVTGAFGVKPCGGCQRRAEALNRFIRFSSR